MSTSNVPTVLFFRVLYVKCDKITKLLNIHPQKKKESWWKACHEKQRSPIPDEVSQERHDRGTSHPIEVHHFSAHSTITGTYKFQDVHVMTHKEARD